MRPRNVHVLFVHGVGRHSRLSSLLQAYQAIRSNLLSREPPITFEDPIPYWSLADFDDGAAPPHLKLTTRYPGSEPGATEAVYFYEVNYSTLAGVIRANQPLNITRLFVGFDLAVNVARERLRTHPSQHQPGSSAIDHVALARIVQKLAGVLVAATVPILGLPSMLMRNYTESFVATFTRFFEDIATFAMDKNGEQLISAHVDRTVDNIVNSDRFKKAESDHSDDVFVIAAHSLGSIVAHNYIVRHWPKGGKEVPAQLLTFGSPVGLICWLWLFLDFPKLAFEQRPPGDNYFCWTPEFRPAAGLQSIQWINVVNHMDPIATAFPLEYVDLARPPKDIQRVLVGGNVAHRFIKTGGILSAGSAHTAYFDNRNRERDDDDGPRGSFIEILARLAQLRDGDALGPAQRPAAEHWKDMVRDLAWLRWSSWLLGMFFLVAYLIVIVFAYHIAWTWALLLLPPYAWPRAMIAMLAFFQRFIFGGPTKRTFVKRIQTLRWSDVAAFPYRLRRKLGLGRVNPDPLAPDPGRVYNLFTGVVSFIPFAVAMVVPILLARFLSGSGPWPLKLIVAHLFVAPVMIAVFVFYLMSFTASEFVAHWRATILKLVRSD